MTESENWEAHIDLPRKYQKVENVTASRKPVKKHSKASIKSSEKQRSFNDKSKDIK